MARKPRAIRRGGASAGGRLPCPGSTGRSQEVPGVATVVQLYGEGDGVKEERLVLRAIGGRDRPREGVRARSRPISPGLGKHANGLPRIR